MTVKRNRLFISATFLIFVISNANASYVNNGNNPGNPRAEGYGTGGNAPTGSSHNDVGAKGPGSVREDSPSSPSRDNSSSNHADERDRNGGGDRSDEYVNDGNNPGNPRAPGYGTGGNAPTGSSHNDVGARGPGAKTPSSSVTGGRTNQSQPGATNDNGSRDEDSERSVVATNKAIDNVLEMANQSSIVRATFSIAKTAYNSIKEIVEPHHQAVMDGIESRNRSVTGTLGVESFSSKQAMERAYYSGVLESYEKQGIPKELRAVPVGPLQEYFKDMNLDPSMASTIQDFDRRFIEEGLMVIKPGEITQNNAGIILGHGVYSKLNPSQKLGLQNSALVIGNKVESGDTGGATYMSSTIAPLATGGIITVNTDFQTGIYEEIISHELQHAGDYATYYEALKIVNDPKSTDSEYELAERALAATESAILDRLSGISGIKGGAVLQRNEYLDQISEFRAYTNQGSDHQLVSQVMNSINSSTAAQLDPSQRVTYSEAKEIVDLFRQSETLREIDQAINEFANQQLK